MKTLTLFLSLFVFSSTGFAQNLITINAAAEVAVPADEIAFQITINAKDESPQKAYNTHKEREKILVSELKKHNISDENIDFEPISISKTYDGQYGEQKKEWVQTRQQVVLTLENFDLYETIQITLIENGFDEFNGNFLSSKTTKGEEEALEKALTIAREKAELIAKTSGLTIKRIQEIDYSYNHRPRPMMEMTAAKSSDSLLEFDQSVRVSASVSVIYNFEEN